MIKLSAYVDEDNSNDHTALSEERSARAKLHLHGNLIKIPLTKANNNVKHGQWLVLIGQSEDP